MSYRPLICLLFVIYFSSCEWSPLFNHNHADYLKKKDSHDSMAYRLPNLDSVCPLDFNQYNLCASLTWLSGPASEVISSFELKFWDKQNGSAEGPYQDPLHDLHVYLWMPSMGHGSSPVTLLRIEGGIFQSHDVYFNMPGDWDVRIRLRSGSSTLQSVSYLLDIFR